jgi:dehydrogenase/reductase SDR family member 7B
MGKLAEFSGKVVVITGGSSGIGLSLAKRLLAAGAKVIVTGRNEKKLEKTTQELSEINLDFIVLKADVSDYESCKNVVYHIIQHFKKIDILINNAGISAAASIENVNPAVIHQVVDTNLKGVYFMTQACLPYIRTTKGSIQIISSIAAFYGLPNYSLYSMTKLSLSAFAQCLELETKADTLFVGLVYLSFTENDSEKYAIDANGEKLIVEKRNKAVVFTRDQTTSLILNQLIKKKRVLVQGKLGKFLSFLRRFPQLHYYLFSIVNNQR